MSRRHRPAPHHESPQEQHLREIVNGFVPAESERAAYLAFARELMLSLRRGPTTPDFSRQTKRVVEKWFRRGLHGNLMWLIGEAVMRRRAG
jgi:hypothetical protein